MHCPVPRLIGILFLSLLAAGCAAEKPAADLSPVKLATTTSTANTGLLDYLCDAFQRDTGITVHYVAVGTGAALKHGENGDVDLVLVHAPEAEQEYVRDGFGVARIPVMWNDFVLAGPAADPAGVAGSGSAAEAFTRICRQQSAFISRGDESGTHKKEQAIWKSAGCQPGGDWYIQAGQGMEACLTMASEKQAYVLTDRGTFLGCRDQLELSLLHEGDPALDNPYSLIATHPSRFPDLNHKGARRLIEWMTSSRGQQLIGAYRVNGTQLFHPLAEGR